MTVPGKGGPTTKLSDNFIEAAEKVLNEDNNAIILTDDELRICINDKLKKDSRICKSTFEKWKAGKVTDKPMYEEFLRVLKKAITIQKVNLFKKMQGDSNGWQRYAWIIERKFSEWNLRQITENTNKNANINIEVEDSIELNKLLKDNNLIG